MKSTLLWLVTRHVLQEMPDIWAEHTAPPLIQEGGSKQDRLLLAGFSARPYNLEEPTCNSDRCENPTSNSIKKLRGFSPQANYTDRATAACLRS
jgi:hypothetical protein